MRKDEGPKEGWWETQRPAVCREPLLALRLNDRGRNHVTWAHWELESGKRGSPEGTIVWLKHGGNEEEYSSCSHVSHMPAGVNAWWKGNVSQEASKPGRCGLKGSASWCPEHSSDGLEKGIGGQRLVSTRIRWENVYSVLSTGPGT